jgi:hypothetical protein
MKTLSHSGSTGCDWLVVNVGSETPEVYEIMKQNIATCAMAAALNALPFDDCAEVSICQRNGIQTTTYQRLCENVDRGFQPEGLSDSKRWS